MVARDLHNFHYTNLALVRPLAVYDQLLNDADTKK